MLACANSACPRVVEGATSEVSRLRLFALSRASAVAIAASAVALCLAPAARFRSAPTSCLPRIATALPPLLFKIVSKSAAE